MTLLLLLRPDGTSEFIRIHLPVFVEGDRILNGLDGPAMTTGVSSSQDGRLTTIAASARTTAVIEAP